MREIKFRAMSHDNIFYYGFFVNSFPNTPRIVSEHRSNPIRIETVGQFTGLKDQNGVEIYEGDILECKHFNPSKYVVEFVEGAFVLTNEKLKGYPIEITHIEDSSGKHFKVIGNIHKHA